MGFRVGQRWFSQAEPELGLGVITEIDTRRIAIAFPALEERRAYAPGRAPLQRYAPEIGQTIGLADGGSLVVESMTETRGLRVYHGADADGNSREVPESLLGTELALEEADQRLLSAQVNKLGWYLLRQQLYHHLSQHNQSPARGLIGGRIDLIPHQFDLASRATRYGLPRALLADEVGLGKTIEAGLIMHRCHELRWADRLLIVVPDALQHQWLMELIRKFGLTPRLLNDDQWTGLMEDDPLANPFDQARQVLLPISLLERETAREQVEAALWDLVVIDEAHHWDPLSTAPVQTTLSRLVSDSDGVLLLTATPEQGGEKAHFARLHALAPEQYTDFQSWQTSEQSLERLGNALSDWLSGPTDGLVSLEPWLQQDRHARAIADRILAAPEDRGLVRRLAEHLISVHGVGRVQFRNSRQEITGFPERQLHPRALVAPSEYDPQAPWPEHTVDGWERKDPRVAWLSGLLHEDRQRKVVVICHHADTARELTHHLSLYKGLATAAFHEHMGLIERDRAAAWFADPVDGAQALICSEIGSEGRNFQFSQTLVLFDLPPHPDLLEQRIGRLDRIGQGPEIHIHAPYLTGHISEVWFHWFNEALEAFTSVCTVGHEVLCRALPDGAARTDLTEMDWTRCSLDEHIARDHDATQRLAKTARNGRQRLLSWASFDAEEAERLLDAVIAESTGNNPREWVITALDRLGFETEPVDDELFQVAPGTDQIPDEFPLAEEGPVLVTFSRMRAVHRDDVHLITWEHPLVNFLADTLDQLHLGRAGVTLIRLPNVEPGRLFLEAMYRPIIQHPAAPRAAQHIDETPLRAVVDHSGKDFSALFGQVDWRDLERPLDRKTLTAIINSQQDAIRTLVRAARAVAEPIMTERQQAGLVHAEESLANEAARLDSLPGNDPASISVARRNLTEEFRVRSDALRQSHVHLDSLRLIVTG